MIESAPTKELTLSGTVMHYENRVLSRHDGPAVIYTDWDEEWWVNGMRHRQDQINPNILLPAICHWGTMQFEYWVKGIFICRNPHYSAIITEWAGMIQDGIDGDIYHMKFDIVRPEMKYKNLYPSKEVFPEIKMQGGKIYGCVTHLPGDEESWD